MSPNQIKVFSREILFPMMEELKGYTGIIDEKMDEYQYSIRKSIDLAYYDSAKATAKEAASFLENYCYSDKFISKRDTLTKALNYFICG